MNEQLSKLWNDPKRPSIVIGVIAFNVGIGFGYILGKRRQKNNTYRIEEVDDSLILDFNEAMSGSPQKVVVVPQEKTEKDISSTPLVSKVIEGEHFIAEKIKEALDSPVEEDDEELVTKSVFTNVDDWNYELEARRRTQDAPYVIHKDEFYSEEAGYAQSTLTYYSGDNILCDEDDSPVYNHDQITGPLLFGHGSGDPNVVHIRNDKRKAEYEILFDPGLYSVEVLGLEIENNQRVEDLKHSRNRKFRLE